MNVLNILIELYGKLHNYKGVPFWVLTPVRKIVRATADKLLPSYLTRLHKKRMTCGKGIIISFTSFPARINEVWKVVETLKNQSVRPERIVLWLSKEQFPNRESVPQSLWECEDGVFEVRLVEGDIRSHKKYYYAMQEFPDKTVVTCDDDIYYSKDMLKSLVYTARLFPHCIIANTTKQILFNEKGELKTYSEWYDLATPYAADNRVQIGEGGVLYPLGCLHELLFRKDLIAELAPLADDLWLNMMARLKKTPVVQSNRSVLPLPIESEAPTLTSVNNGVVNMNDVQIQKMRSWLKKEGLNDVYDVNYHIDKPEMGGGRIVVSFTSYPARINTVWRVVECMLNQTYQPKAIFLWLSREQFQSEDSIPESLRKLEGDIFKIRMVDGDIRSHKKYYYVAKECPDDYIFLIDDDTYYSTDLLERAWNECKKHKNSVICHYGYHINYKDDGSLDDYDTWKECYNFSEDDNLFFGSGGGTLLKPSELYKDLTNLDLAIKLTPTADDIWLNAMTRLADKKIIMLSNGLPLEFHNGNDGALTTVNKGESKNDIQISAVENYYNQLGKAVFSKFIS